MGFKPDFESLNGIRDAAERIQLAEEFLSATTAQDYKILDEKYPRIFGENAQGQGVDDIASVCEMMRKANEMYALTRSDGGIDISDWLNVGLSPVFMSVSPADANPDEIEADTVMLSYAQRVNGGNYCFWLSDAVKRVQQRFPWYSRFAMRFIDGILSDDAPMRQTADIDKLRDDCCYILSRLINIHLADVATVCNDGIRPAQMAYSGISCLWLGLVERMSGGRAYRCKACDKPSVAYNERRRREYCCPACKKWSKKHPDEKRGYWYYEKR